MNKENLRIAKNIVIEALHNFRDVVQHEIKIGDNIIFKKGKGEIYAQILEIDLSFRHYMPRIKIKNNYTYKEYWVNIKWLYKRGE